MAGDPLKYFRVEARELIDQISAGVLNLDQDHDPEVVAQLLRYAHTLKGAARVVRQPEIAERAHAFEEVLVDHREGDSPLAADDMRELLRLNDEIEQRVAALEPKAAPAQTSAAAQKEQPVEVASARASSGDVDDLLDAIGEAHTRFAPLRTGSKSLDRLHRDAEALADRLRVEQPGAFQAARSAALRLSGEFSRLSRRMTDVVEQVERELDEVRGRAERLRLVAA